MLRLSASSTHRCSTYGALQSCFMSTSPKQMHQPLKGSRCRGDIPLHHRQAELRGAGLSPPSATRSGARASLQDAWVQTEWGGGLSRNQAQIAQCSQWDVSVELQQKAGESLGFVETIARFLLLTQLQDRNVQPVCKRCHQHLPSEGKSISRILLLFWKGTRGKKRS